MACTVKFFVHEGIIMTFLIRDIRHAICEMWIIRIIPHPFFILLLIPLSFPELSLSFFCWFFFGGAQFSY